MTLTITAGVGAQGLCPQPNENKVINAAFSLTGLRKDNPASTLHSLPQRSPEKVVSCISVWIASSDLPKSSCRNHGHHTQALSISLDILVVRDTWPRPQWWAPQA